MLTISDLNYIYNLVERANITGQEVDKVVALKLKIIDILQQAAGMPKQAPTQTGVAPAPVVEEVVPATVETSTEPANSGLIS